MPETIRPGASLSNSPLRRSRDDSAAVQFPSKSDTLNWEMTLQREMTSSGEGHVQERVSGCTSRTPANIPLSGRPLSALSRSTGEPHQEAGETDGEHISEKGNRMKRIAFVLWGLLICVPTVSAQESDRTLNYLPRNVNSLAIVRVQEILNSPKAKKEGWDKRPTNQFLGGALEAGKDVRLVVRGLEFHPEDSRLIQSTGLILFGRALSMSELARRENGHLDKLVEKTSAHLPKQGYYVAVEPNLLGQIEPSYRQSVVRWLRDSAQQKQPVISSYLQDAYKLTAGHIVLVIDLQDMVDPRTMRERLANFTLLAPDPKQRDAVANLVERLQGVRLSVTVGDTIDCEIAVDFSTRPGDKLSGFVQPLFAEVLNRNGLQIEELESAQARLEGNAVVFKMTLSEATARQILSLAFAETSGLSMPVEGDVAPSTEQTETNRAIAATKNYVGAVDRMVADLETKSKRTKTYQATATWHETYARKIDQLSVRDVDPLALEYAKSVSSDFRALAVSLRGVPIEINRLQHSVTYNVDYTPWGYGFNMWGGIGFRPQHWQVNTNEGELQAQGAAAIAAGEEKRNEVWKMIADSRQDLKIKLSEKYKQDF